MCRAHGHRKPPGRHLLGVLLLTLPQCVEEILGYLKSCFSREPVMATVCVQQVRKSFPVLPFKAPTPARRAQCCLSLRRWHWGRVRQPCVPLGPILLLGRGVPFPLRCRRTTPVIIGDGSWSLAKNRRLSVPPGFCLECWVSLRISQVEAPRFFTPYTPFTTVASCSVGDSSQRGSQSEFLLMCPVSFSWVESAWETLRVLLALC